ncbi:MAG: phosphate acyltransferase, partial [Saprospiraceae bacterium]
EKVDWSREFMRNIYIMAKKEPKRIVFPEGDNPKIIWAASELAQEGYARPILLTKNKKALIAKFKELHHDARNIEIVEPEKWPYCDDYVKEYYRLRQRKGKTQSGAVLSLENYFYFGTMMVHQGHADGLVAGVSVSVPSVLRPALKIIGPRKGNKIVGGMYLLQHEGKSYFFADSAVNINPDVDQLTEITLMAAEQMERMQIEPQVAMLSFSNFGSVRSPETKKIRETVERVQHLRPGMIIDGPMQPDVALNPDFLAEHYPFAKMSRRPNLLVFPNLDAANISLRLVRQLSDTHTIGPIMFGMAKPIQTLQKGTEVNNIVNVAAITCVDAQKMEAQKLADV